MRNRTRHPSRPLAPPRSPLEQLPDDFDREAEETDQSSDDAGQAHGSESQPEAISEPPKVELEERDIRAILGSLGSQNYAPRHLSVRLDRRQSIAWRKLWVGLDHAGARLANGRRVHSSGDAIRWLLEQLG